MADLEPSPGVWEDNGYGELMSGGLNEGDEIAARLRGEEEPSDG